MTLEVPCTACLVAGVSFLDQLALRFRLLCDILGVLGKLFVHPVHGKLGALVTSCILACCTASLDRGQVLASLHERGPWLRAFSVAHGIVAALPVASTSFLHHLVHLLPVLLFAMLAVVVSTLMMAIKHRWALVVALMIARFACLMACVHFFHHWTLLLRHLYSLLGALGKFLVHPLELKLGALVAICVLAFCEARFDGWEVPACLHKWFPRLRAP